MTEGSELFQTRSRKETNSRAMNGSTSELTLISANVTSWKKNFNETVGLNLDIMALQKTKVTMSAKPAANRAAGSEQLSVVWTAASKLRKIEWTWETLLLGSEK